ncbi:MAG TPA: hypothetical protein VE978_15605 [Chitinophagales bacterium]|nr:hypothetical protein [Chitinophagales bacterium]
MKKFLFIQRKFSVVVVSVLLLIPFPMNAQVYHPLVDSGAVWNSEIHLTDMGTEWDNYGSKFFLKGDTVIQGLSYSLLKWQPTYHYFYAQGFPPTYYGSNYNSSAINIGAVREDSEKVWLRLFNYVPNNCPSNLPFNKDTLLYDFNLQIGETFNSGYNSFVMEIDDVQLLNGEMRKRWYFSNGDFWIEGIGSEGGILSPLEIHFECGSQLTCYRKNSELLYESIYTPYFTATCDSLLLGVENPTYPSTIINISPNPAYDLFTVNFSSPNFSSTQIKITDVFGRNLFSGGIKSNQPLQIATEKFSGNNMLFCELWQDGKLIAVKKVLIQQ